MGNLFIDRAAKMKYNKIGVICATLLTVALSLYLLLAPRTTVYRSVTSSLGNSLQRLSSANEASSGDLNDVFNGTVGFQQVRVISLLERSDKRDAVSMQARFTNISFDFVDGVVGTDMNPKALPHTMHIAPGAVGCWRSHLNVMQEMVRRRIRSSLILEDDADWDVAFKSQMSQVARGTRWLLNQTDDTPTHSPYGDGWDVIWLGHCGSKPDPKDNRRWVIPRDPTVVPPHKRWSLYMFGKPDMSPWQPADNQTRIVYVPVTGVCSAGWAISMAGAEKILYYQSMIPFDKPVDDGVGAMCRDKVLGLRCFAPWPQIIGVSKPAGPKSRGSDIDDFGAAAAAAKSSSSIEEVVKEKPRSHGVMFSTRLNIERFIGKEETFETQHPEYTGQFMTLEQIGNAVGHGEILPS
ncbi:hypothetical protein LTS17_000508 [Exophiala oligosperma]